MPLRGHREAAQCLHLYLVLIALFLLFTCVTLTSLRALWGPAGLLLSVTPTASPGAQGTLRQNMLTEGVNGQMEG